ncbi:MAG: DUF86 domain-containing protein [Limnochordaceae bacterium]|nr:DUF86 domain-containing protein [Limnochordaceae bacterium]
MVQLTPEQFETIQRRLDILRVEAGDIPRFATMTQAEYVTNRDRRGSLERMVENILNAATDISKVVLTAMDLPAPDSYRQTMLQLGMSGLLPSATAAKLAEMTRLRNILAHEYLDIRWESLRAFLQEAPSVVNEFIQIIEHLLTINTVS